MKKIIYLAGGCFWGMEKYFQNAEGVLGTEVGYANGNTDAPTYEEVCHKNTGHAETLCITYDDDIISLKELLKYYFEVIDPVSVNRQGGDTGIQYRTGVYFTDAVDEAVIANELKKLQERYSEPVAVECLPLKHFYRAEEYHQKYLDKNPSGYCHIHRPPLGSHVS